MDRAPRPPRGAEREPPRGDPAPPPAAARPPKPPVEAPPEPGAEAEAPTAEKQRKEPKKPKKRPSYEMKLFGKYDMTDVAVRDAGLAKYMNLSPIVIPHTGGRWANKPFGKAKANLVERLINNMMRTENYTGKKSKAYRV